MKKSVARRTAYVDTSCLVSIALQEHGSTALERRLATFDNLVSSNLLEAELSTVLVREGVVLDSNFLAPLSWILPDRPLSSEIERVLTAGYLRGADCWHVATALYVVNDPTDIAFLTLAAKQREVVRSLGFKS
jgi:predicted nucleic acid-binding protein